MAKQEIRDLGDDLLNDIEFVGRLPREALQQLQLRKFRSVLGEVLASNEFYSKKLTSAGLHDAAEIRSLSDLSKLPFTGKRELSEDQQTHLPFGTNLTYPLERYIRVHQTSGTTGAPLMVLDTRESWNWWGRCWETVYRSCGVSSEDRIFLAFSFGPFVGFWSAYEGAMRLGALVMPGGGMSTYQRLHSLLKNEATVLVCTPTYALHLAEVAQEEGIDIAGSSVRVTIHAGEPGAGLPATRRRIEAAWGASCFDHAGATEVGAWGFETEQRDGLYVNEAEFIAEVIDPISGQPAQEGELVLTNLGRAGMPVIRYRTGDRVRICPASPRSRYEFIRLDGGVIGRVDDAMIIRGVNVFPSAIENIVRSVSEVGEFAADVYRSEGGMDDLVIRAEVSRGEPAAVTLALEKAIRSSLGLRVKVEAVDSGSLPRFDLKARRFTDHRPA